MNHLPLLISEYGSYFLIGIAFLSLIGVIAICNAENCISPAKCFDCSDTSCRQCCHFNLKQRSEQLAWEPDTKQPAGVYRRPGTASTT
jgi:hypothetical protein